MKAIYFPIILTIIVFACGRTVQEVSFPPEIRLISPAHEDEVLSNDFLHVAGSITDGNEDGNITHIDISIINHTEGWQLDTTFDVNMHKYNLDYIIRIQVEEYSQVDVRVQAFNDKGLNAIETRSIVVH